MNIVQFLQSKLSQKPITVSQDQVKSAQGDKMQFDMLRKFGVVQSDLRKALEAADMINFERQSLYGAVDKSLAHPLMSAAPSLFADVATNYNRTNNATVWVTADSREYQYQIEKFLDIINVEEVIYDWAWTIATFGDLFVNVHGEPGVGIVSVSDDDHPLNISRVDYNGRCFTGDTKVRLLDGTTPSFKEMSKNSARYIGKAILSINPSTNTLEPDRIVNLGKTRENAALVRVHVDNNTYVDCTPDHRFMLRDGSFKEAKDLQAGQSLMPLYEKFPEKGLTAYKMAYDPASGKFHYLHRFVPKFILGRTTPKGTVIHHKDFNCLNNEPSNLVEMLKDAHYKLHSESRKGRQPYVHKADCRCVSCLSQRGEAYIHRGDCQCEACTHSYEVRTCAACSDTFNCLGTSKQITCSVQCQHVWQQTRKGYLTGFWNINKGKTFEEIYGSVKASELKQRWSEAHSGEKNGRFGRKMAWVANSTETRQVPLEEAETYVQSGWVRGRKLQGTYLNHRVVRVEFLSHREDVYDLQTERNHTFPLDIGVFVHNCVGFYETPGGYNSSAERKLEAPWSKVHFRLLGAKRRRPQYQADGANYSEYRTVNIVAPDVRRLTSKYGTSVLSDALPIYKRLRLAEDSIMMARITRGVLRYLYKIGIDKSNSNNEAVMSLIDNYVSTLKEARSFNLDTNSPSFNSKFNGMNAVEDIIMPVFGDVNQVVVDKLGGEVDIKWIEDVDLLTKQLSTALKIPLPLLAGYAEAANGGLGQNSLEKLDIRFARQSRRIQRALITGLTRLAQIHLAYQGINPDLKMFQIHMSETSTAEENEIQESLDKGVDVTNKVMELLEKVLGVDFNKEEALKYLNEKFLKLTDIDLEKLKLKANTHAFDKPDERLAGFGDSEAPLSSTSENPFKANAEQGEPAGEETPEAAPETKEAPEEEEAEPVFKENIIGADLKSMLPLNEAQWNAQWGKTIVKITGLNESK